MWITYGQWLQMNMTSNAGAPLKSASETVLPFVSGREKSGATVPSGSMVEGVRAICFSDQYSMVSEQRMSKHVKPLPLFQLFSRDYGSWCASQTVYGHQHKSKTHSLKRKQPGVNRNRQRQ